MPLQPHKLHINRCELLHRTPRHCTINHQPLKFHSAYNIWQGLILEIEIEGGDMYWAIIPAEHSLAPGNWIFSSTPCHGEKSYSFRKESSVFACLQRPVADSYSQSRVRAWTGKEFLVSRPINLCLCPVLGLAGPPKTMGPRVSPLRGCWSNKPLDSANMAICT